MRSDQNNKTELLRPTFSLWPFFSDDEIEAATNTLRSGNVNYHTGDEGKSFEKEFSAYVGCDHSIAVANGTLALELALYAIGIGYGDEVIVPCRTFIATASSVVMSGAVPVMADIHADSQNITAESIEAALTSRTRAIIVVHLAGWPCDMDTILGVAHEHGLAVIEDCAQAHGARYKGRMVGSFGDAAAFSFCQDKIMTTGGEGGMLCTSDEEIWNRAWSYKDHGKSYGAMFNTDHPPGFRWLHESFGTNMRMTEMQSAIGRIQLTKLPDWLRLRRRNAAMLEDYLLNIPSLRVPLPPVREVEHSYYKFYAFVRPEYLQPEWNRDRIIQAINEEGIPCGSGSCGEIYLEKAFKDRQMHTNTRLPVAKQLSDTSLMFLVHPTLSEDDMEYTCSVVDYVMWRACS